MLHLTRLPCAWVPLTTEFAVQVSRELRMSDSAEPCSAPCLCQLGHLVFISIIPVSLCRLIFIKYHIMFILISECHWFQRPKHRQSLLQKLEVEGHILTKHQKEVFRHRKHDIPVLYNSTLQPLQEDSIISESSQDT